MHLFLSLFFAITCPLVLSRLGRLGAALSLSFPTRPSVNRKESSRVLLLLARRYRYRKPCRPSRCPRLRLRPSTPRSPPRPDRSRLRTTTRSGVAKRTPSLPTRVRSPERCERTTTPLNRPCLRRLDRGETQLTGAALLDAKTGEHEVPRQECVRQIQMYKGALPRQLLSFANEPFPPVRRLADLLCRRGHQFFEAVSQETTSPVLR